MKTKFTLELDDDVLERARALSAKLGTPFRANINDALRSGLDHVERPAEQKPYKTKPHAMGLKSGRNLDNIQELLSQEDTRIYRANGIQCDSKRQNIVDNKLQLTYINKKFIRHRN